MNKEEAAQILLGKAKGDYKMALATDVSNPPDHFILCTEAWAKGLRDLYTNDMKRIPAVVVYPTDAPLPQIIGFGPFIPTPYPSGAGEPFTPEPEAKPTAPAQCSKCKEPFPYEAHESGKCYRCRSAT